MKMQVRRLIVACLVATLTQQSFGQSLPEAFYPESLAASQDGTLFTGSAVQASMVRIRPDAPAAEAFVASGAGGLMSVQGLLVDNGSGRLYACTADLGVAISPKVPSALLAFNVATGEFLGRWPLPEGGLCNDIAVAPDGTLLITDTAKPRLLAFDPAGDRLAVWVEHSLLGGAQLNGNGIALDRGSVYVDTFSDGRLIRIPMLANGRAGTPQTITLPRALAGADALRALSPGRLLAFENDIPGGNGQITAITIRGNRAMFRTIAEGLAEPVSGIVQGDTVLVVESQFRKLFGPERGQAPEPFRLRRIMLPQSGAALRSIYLPLDATYPNGIARTTDGTLYIGQITNGAIWQRSPQGNWSRLFPGAVNVFAGTALRLDAVHHRLWGASPDFLPKGRTPRAHRIFALDVQTGRLQQSLMLPDGGFGNDLALEPNGRVLITDSIRGRVLELDPDTHQFTIKIDDHALASRDGIGAAGIALAPNGELILGNYESGRLYVTDSGNLRELLLPRRLENPDGIALAEDGALIVLEGAVQSGDGRVLRIPAPTAVGRRSIEVLAYGLESPTNLTQGPDGMMLVTESRIRHRLIPGREADAPDRFRVVEILTRPRPRSAR